MGNGREMAKDMKKKDKDESIESDRRSHRPKKKEITQK